MSVKETEYPNAQEPTPPNDDGTETSGQDYFNIKDVIETEHRDDHPKHDHRRADQLSSDLTYNPYGSPGDVSIPINLYKRITSRVIPTLHASFNHSESEVTSPGDSPEDDDIDMAKFVDAKPQKTLLDMIVSSQVYSDVSNFVNHRRRSDSKASKASSTSSRSNNPKILGYGLVDSSSEEDDDDSDNDVTSVNETLHSEYFTDPDEFEDAEEGDVTNQLDDENTDQDSTLKSALLDESVSNSSTLMNRLNIDDDPINYDKLSPFQKSILDHLKFYYDGGVLMKFKEDFERLENSNDVKFSKVKLKIAERLQKVFQLKPSDQFYSGYTAWLIRDVFLQGHVYLTRDAFLYFAFLPQRYRSITSNKVGEHGTHDDSDFYIQSGSLTMKTKKYGEILSTVLTTRLWAILRPGTLSIYTNPTDLYFPTLVIDLRTCTKVEILDKYQPNVGSSSTKIDSPSGVLSPRETLSRHSEDYLGYDDEEVSKMLAQELEENKDSVSGGVWFKLSTHKKSYKFQTDNMYSAREWVNNITKLMFQLHNSNSKNEVLIKIPFSQILRIDRKGLFDSDKEDTNDLIPATYCVTYKTPGQKLGERAKSRGIGGDNVESLIFAFFTKSNEFQTVINKILADRDAQKSSSSDSRTSEEYNNSLLSKMKLLKLENSTEEEPLSTLVPGGNSGNIIDQVSDFNEEIAKLFNLSPNHPDSKIKKFGKTISSKVFPKNNRSNSTSSFSLNVNTKHSDSYHDIIGSTLSTSIPKAFRSPSSILSAENSLSSSPTHSQLVSPVDSLQRSSSTSPSNINLPRQLSLTGLMNLNMNFELSTKKLNVAEERYNSATEDDKNAGEDLTDRYFHSSEASSTTATRSDGDNDTLKAPVALNAALPGALNLTDPSEYEEFDTRKDNKLKSLGKSIKALGNVSSLWNAQPNHYIKLDENDSYFVQDETARQIGDRHFRGHFSLSNANNLSASYFCHVLRALPVYGKLYVGNQMICFRSLLPGVSTRMILPLNDVENCYKTKGTKITYSGLVVVIKGKEKLFIEFSSQKARDDCLAMALEMLHKLHGTEAWVPKAHEWGRNYDLELGRQRLNDSNFSFKPTEEALKQSKIRIENARVKLFEDRFNAAAGIQLPLVLEDSPFFKTEIKPSTSYHFVLLTIGSRGDVQPYIALGKGLMEEGHKVTIATHSEFEPWIMSHGINFKEVAGDPGELMSLMVTHGSLSVAFIKEASAKFKGWISDLLKTSWEACQSADILIESPSAMGGVHIAEALGIPYMRAFTMPWTRTRAYSHAFVLPDQKKGGSYNYLTHVMFETVFWKGISSQVNKWRSEVLDLPKTNLFKLQQSKIPFLYNVSQSVLPPAVDFPDWVKVTGYWFLDEGDVEKYNPPEKLQEFIDKATRDEKKIVYIGFGSIVVSDAKSLTQAVVEAVLDADVRCILNKGWSDRLTNDNKEIEVELPPEVFNSGAIPHDWLFPKIDAAVHHGGSGTTGATLRSGLPTIIKPFFGDQFFYASRVEEIGAGMALRKLNAKSLTKALKIATSDIKMIEKAKRISDKIRNENGVLSAIEAIYSELEYARSLIINRQLANEQAKIGGRSGTQTPMYNEDLTDQEVLMDSDYDYDDDSAIELSYN